MPTPNSSTRFAIDIGTVIKDTYRIDAMIGRGGMGAVFVASHLRLPGNKVAIKVLHTGAEDAEVMARFDREARIAAKLQHPNIVQVFDVNKTEDGTPYLVLEYLQGSTLAERIAAGPLPIEQTIRIIRQVGSALAAAHREGIVHRDLKPQNIFLVAPEGENTVEVAKVLDFGISKIRGSQTVKTMDNALLGTPQYMAPEQATGKHDSVDERTDIFALGAIVHEMVSGKPAFSGDSIPEVVFKVVYEPSAPLPDTVPADIAATIARAMAKKSDERFPTIDAFVVALTGTKLSGGRVVIEPPPAPDQFAAGSKHSVHHGGAELASTLASGDHGPATSVGIADTIDSAKLPASIAPVAPTALTVSSLPPGASAPSSSQVMAVADTKAASVATDSRSIWGKVLAAGGAVAAAAVAVFMFVNMKSGERSAGRPAPVSVDPGNSPPAPGALDAKAVLDNPSPKPGDELTKVVSVDAGIDAATPATTPTVKAPTPKTPVKTSAVRDDNDQFDETRSIEGVPTLVDVRRARERGDASEAINLANQIIGSPEAPPAMKARAHLQLGLTKCLLQQDRSGAMTEYRLLGRSKLAARLASQCKLDVN